MEVEQFTRVRLDPAHELRMPARLVQATRFASHAGGGAVDDIAVLLPDDDGELALHNFLLAHWTHVQAVVAYLGLPKHKASVIAAATMQWDAKHIACVMPLILWLDLAPKMIGKAIAPVVRAHVEHFQALPELTPPSWQSPLDPVVQAHMVRLELGEHCVLSFYNDPD